MIELRRSKEGDLDRMAEIAAEGKALLRSSGVAQWQKGTYPDRAVFEQDIRDGIGYVLADGDEILAVCAVTFTDEACYRNLKSGAWLTGADARYATIHRSAMAAAHRGKGLSAKLFEETEKLAWAGKAESIRVDTHPDNLGMQKALEKAGFTRCGELILTDGDEAGDLRYGYEKRV